MNFKCKRNDCGQLFDSENNIIKHLKNDHGMKEKSHEFICIINNDCKKQYLLVKSLRNHAKKCMDTRYVLEFNVHFIVIFTSSSKTFKRCILCRPPTIDTHHDIHISADIETDTLNATNSNEADVILIF